MKRILSRVYQSYLNPELDFRVRVFNALLLALVVIGIVMAVVSITDNAGIVNTALVFGAS